MTWARASLAYKALILATGEGTRLRPLTSNCPKPMLPINGTPLLEHTVRWLCRYGVTHIAINLHHCPQMITNHFGDGSAFGIHIVYSYEDPILGTAGAAHKLRWFLAHTPFVIVYGDILTDLDLSALMAFHSRTVAQDPSARLTMCLYPVSNPTEVGLVGLDEVSRITRFVEKPKPEEVFTNLASAGILVAEPEILDYIPPDTFFDFGQDLFPRLLEAGISMYGWVIPDQAYLLDIGTPEKYLQGQREWPLRHPAIHPAVFLDRDGVINYNRSDYVKSWAEFEFLPGALEALRRLAPLGWPTLVVSNQSAIGQGLTTRQTVDDIHQRMIDAISKAGGRIDAVLYCPHHSDAQCLCRKPRPELLWEAQARFQLDLTRSFLVGDAESDILAALATGSRPILVRTGRGREQLTQLDKRILRHLHVANDLLEAVDWIWEQAAIENGRSAS